MNVRPDLTRLRTMLNGRPAVTRFAPSPTGYLHMGHLVNALYVWGIARALGGKVILRLEDHDRNRCKAAYETAILDDLDRLGLLPDVGTTSELRAGASDFRQSDCGAHYERQLQALAEKGLVYGCSCSRRALRARLGDIPPGELRYDGHCRDRGLPPGDGQAIRLRLPEGTVVFDDLLAGPQAQAPAQQCGDMVLRDNKGNWSYQFCVTVDDVRHGVQLVIRGLDIIESTGRQVLLANLLGAENIPVHVHHGLLMAEPGKKLSKHNHAPAIRDMMNAGESPEEILGRAASMCGLLEVQRPLSAAELAELFLQDGKGTP